MDGSTAGVPGVFVTGVSSGIGAAIAVELARTGHRGAERVVGGPSLRDQRSRGVVLITLDVLTAMHRSSR
jgi:NAD(P)-dependent dehydrogenase (short-subunit alcohol dehydrogenase family)